MPPTHSRCADPGDIDELVHWLGLLKSLQNQIETIMEENRKIHGIREDFNRRYQSAQRRMNTLERRIRKTSLQTRQHIENRVASSLDFSLAPIKTKYLKMDNIMEQIKLFLDILNSITQMQIITAIDFETLRCQFGLIQQKLTLLEKITSPQCCIAVNGVYDCCVTNYCLKRANAKYECLSMYFKTSKNGFQILFTIYPNGFGTGVGTHLSVGISIMMGPFDALLPWPFPHAITIRLINQLIAGDCIEVTLESSTDHEALNRPSSMTNQTRSVDRFVPLSVLMNEANGFLANDALIIQVYVEGNVVDAGDIVDVANAYTNIHPVVSQATD